MFGKARRRKFPPSSVNDGREQSHDSYAGENEQDLQEGLPEKKTKQHPRLEIPTCFEDITHHRISTQDITSIVLQ